MSGVDLDALAASHRPDDDLAAVVADLFDRYRGSRGEPALDLELATDLWDQLDALGLTRLSVGAEAGGSGATWLESALVIGLAAGAAAPVPLVEHDVLAGWLLEVAGLPHDGALRTVARPDRDGTARGVTWAEDAAGIVALWQQDDRWLVADVPRERARTSIGRDLAGVPVGTVDLDPADLAAGSPVPESVAEQLHQRGALARCVQVVGAMDRVVELVVAHVTDRVQFGRPLGRFQAVQALVADLAAEAALARAATDTAVGRAAASGWTDPGMGFWVATAKSCVGRSASVVVRNAHQALGAIGTTLEHELHSLTRPILVWRGDYGTVQSWEQHLTELALAAGPTGLWPLIVDGHPTEGARRHD